MNPSLNSQHRLPFCEICDLYVDCLLSKHLESTYHRYHEQKQQQSHLGPGGANDANGQLPDDDINDDPGDTLTGSATPPPDAVDTYDITEESPRQRRMRIGRGEDWLLDRDDSSALSYVEASDFPHSAWC